MPVVIFDSILEVVRTTVCLDLVSQVIARRVGLWVQELKLESSVVSIFDCAAPGLPSVFVFYRQDLNFSIGVVMAFSISFFKLDSYCVVVRSCPLYCVA